MVSHQVTPDQMGDGSIPLRTFRATSELRSEAERERLCQETRAVMTRSLPWDFAGDADTVLSTVVGLVSRLAQFLTARISGRFPQLFPLPRSLPDPDNALMATPFIRTLRLKVRPESYGWLNAAAIEVNQVFNFANEAARAAATRTDLKRKWLSGFDLCKLTAGASEHFQRIGADTIQRICVEYAQKRAAAKRLKLRWRVSYGARRSLGWIPLKAASLKRKGNALRCCGKTFRVFERARLEGVKWKQGCFSQDAVGDWWLCLPVEQTAEAIAAPKEAVGIDLGLKDAAVTSEGERLEALRFYRDAQRKLGSLQRRGHRRQAKRLHRRIRRRRLEACHRFSRRMVDTYQTIIVGDVSSLRLAKTRMAKSVLDSGWGLLKMQLQYKGQQAGRRVAVVNERDTTRACSSCGALTGPSGLRHLVVRSWVCAHCGEWHDRDVNAARNILMTGLRCGAPVSGNEPSPAQHPPSQITHLREAGPDAVQTAA
jgi:putative transposase